jgi:hypothetical protein
MPVSIGDIMVALRLDEEQFTKQLARQSAQEQYWRLVELRGRHRRLGGMAMWLFLQSHRGQSFKAFKPEWVDRMFKDDVEKWDL